MAQLQSEESKGLQHQHCHFPTYRQPERTTVRSVQIFSHKDSSQSGLRILLKSSDAVQNAWAILLRHYVQNDLVCFAVLSKPAVSEGIDRVSTEPPLDSNNPILIAQYQINDSLRLSEVRVYEYQSCTRDDLQDRRINTAVDFGFSGILLGRREVDRKPGYFGAELDLVLHANASLLQLEILYQYPTISSQFAISIASTFSNIVETLASQDELLLSSLSLVSHAGQQKMKSWNPADPFSVKKNACLHHLVEAKVRMIPDYEAVCAWDGTLTYNQLDQLSNVVATRLVLLGAGPGVFIPFAFEKTMWTVVATLGILKSGAAFVPINPNDPEARLVELLKSVNAHVILTMDCFLPKYKKLVHHVLVVSSRTTHLGLMNGDSGKGHSLNGEHSTETEDAHGKISKPSDPVFVLFTSGSTGRPKGMVHEHAAICTHALVHGKSMGYHEARVLQFAAHTFDVAIIDMFTTLLFGGCICIPSEEGRRTDIVGIINAMKANYAILTPSFAGLIEPSDVPTLKTLAIGGEALPQDRIQRWAEKVHFIQIYGPAEVGICLTQEMDPCVRPETVGSPLPNSSCWLVDPDDSDRLVPIGAVGELCVAGPSLAHGYLNDEAQTQTSFIYRPRWAVDMNLPFSRFYKTGDLLKYNTNAFDGSFDFVGRKDAQIKLRGQRIEPGEVEYYIGQLSGVAISMVARPEEGCFAGELVAIIQMRNKGDTLSRLSNAPIMLSSSSSLSIETVQGYLSKHLPGYMIPSVYLVIENMPLVPSLKIDRRAVNSWLRSVEERPFDMLVGCLLSRLEPSETTAFSLSQKVADIISKRGKYRYTTLAGYNFRLQQAGVDSVQIISLSMHIRKHYPSTTIPMAALLSPTITVRELARLVDKQRTKSTDGSAISNGVEPPHGSVNMARELKSLRQDLHHRSTHIPPVDPNGHHHHAQAPRRNILLTGATGYLGTAILHHLLLQSSPNIQIYTLVRCPNPSAGLQRIITSATTQGWWHPHHTARIHIWPGDLAQPNLGLSPPHLSLLQTTNHIGSIIHSGARVHYSTPYPSLKAANVLSTLFLLQQTAQTPGIDTFVFVAGGEKPNASTTITHLDADASGYTQSKVVSEQLVRGCVAEEGFRGKKRLHVVKPGYIIGSPANGMANRNDFIWRLVKGCVEIGAYNADEVGRWLFVEEVESVGRKVVDGILRGEGEEHGGPGYESGHVERVLDGLWFGDLWDMLQREFGYRLVAMGGEEWMDSLKGKVLEDGEEHVLFPLLHTLEYDGNAIGEQMEPVGDVERMKRVVRRNVQYLIDVSFLPAAPGVE